MTTPTVLVATWRNGLFVVRGRNSYMKRYYQEREATEFEGFDGIQGFDDLEFFTEMGYSIYDLIELFGQATYGDPLPEEANPAPPGDIGPAAPMMMDALPMQDAQDVTAGMEVDHGAAGDFGNFS